MFVLCTHIHAYFVFINCITLSDVEGSKSTEDEVSTISLPFVSPHFYHHLITSLNFRANLFCTCTIFVSAPTLLSVSCVLQFFVLNAVHS